MKTSSQHCSFLFPLITGSSLFPNELLMSCQLLMQIEKKTDTKGLLDTQLKHDPASPLKVIKNVNCSNSITGLDSSFLLPLCFL